MKKSKYLASILIIALALLFSLSSCQNDTKKSNYEYGSFNENIENKFDLVTNTQEQIAISGGFKTICINYAQTKDGGWVAWKDHNYGYTKTNNINGLCSAFALHFEYIEPTTFD